MLEALSFNSINNEKHVNKLCSINLSKVTPIIASNNYTRNCSVCSRNTKQPNSSIPCPNCKHLIHKKCSNLNPNQLLHLKRHPNVWECPFCVENKFPFANVEDEFLEIASFNSNWTCNCKHRSITPCNDNSTYKLVLDKFKNSEKIDEFDEQFDTYHTLKPNFKYYETHEFHMLKDKVKNPFSLLHTNIRSLPFNGDNLKMLLTNLEFKFDIIALSET